MIIQKGDAQSLKCATLGMLMVSNNEFKIVEANEFFSQLFDIAYDEFIGKSIYDIHSKAGKELREALSKLQDNHVYTFKVLHSSGKTYYLCLRSEKFVSGRKLFLIYDITKEIETKDNKIKKVPVYDGENMRLISLEAIDYIKGKGIYSLIITSYGKYLCPLSLKKLQERIENELFVRVHRSYIVNLDKVEEIVKDQGRYSLKIDGHDCQILIGRSQINHVLKQFGLK
ncbi:LytTR family transcriptional regulator DNA-binding domain-containing protein [Desulfovulcanus sp.]